MMRRGSIIPSSAACLLPFWMLIAASVAFAPGCSRKYHSTALQMAELGSTVVSMDSCDIVKVDLDDGRDYPIYIGTKFSDEEGAQKYLNLEKYALIPFTLKHMHIFGSILTLYFLYILISRLIITVTCKRKQSIAHYE